MKALGNVLQLSSISHHPTLKLNAQPRQCIVQAFNSTRSHQTHQPQHFRNARLTVIAADHSSTTVAASLSSTSSSSQPQVVLTREAGKNGKIKKLLESRGISCLEMPLIETAKGPDTDRLPEHLSQHSSDYDWICITSPEAASVFMNGWVLAGRPPVRIAVVGEGTGRVFTAAGEEALTPQFTPSVANAEHFGPELPFIPGGSNRVLYPSSNKASTLLQEGLLARGFLVYRLNTYDTLPVTALDEDQLKIAREASVVAVASPSAVKAWVGFVGETAAAAVVVACIGSTSARAAEKLGLTRVFYPKEPSLENFAASIEEALAAAVTATA